LTSSEQELGMGDPPDVGVVAANLVRKARVIASETLQELADFMITRQGASKERIHPAIMTPAELRSKATAIRDAQQKAVIAARQLLAERSFEFPGDYREENSFEYEEWRRLCKETGEAYGRNAALLTAEEELRNSRTREGAERDLFARWSTGGNAASLLGDSTRLRSTRTMRGEQVEHLPASLNAAFAEAFEKGVVLGFDDADRQVGTTRGTPATDFSEVTENLYAKAKIDNDAPTISAFWLLLEASEHQRDEVFVSKAQEVVRAAWEVALNRPSQFQEDLHAGIRLPRGLDEQISIVLTLAKEAMNRGQFGVAG
jgi:hypothetical protein